MLGQARRTRSAGGQWLDNQRQSERRPFPTVHHGSETFRIPMQTQNIIERAFQLAADSTSIEEIRKVLRREGYSNVDAHLEGASIKAQLKKRFVS
jgi:hypothetical protein